MTTLYTDIEPFCCEVLRARVEDGGLPPGEVWERDVCTITAEEVRRFDHVHLFAGIGASPLGLAWAGWPESLSIMTGGFPCQDISAAGKGAGLDGARSGLFFEFVRLAGARRPDWLLAENVGALSARGLDRVAGALGAVGYNVHALRVGAWAVGSPQERERWWIVANTIGDGWRSPDRHANDEHKGAAPEVVPARGHQSGELAGHDEGRRRARKSDLHAGQPHANGSGQSRQLDDLRGAGQGTERGGPGEPGAVADVSGTPVDLGQREPARLEGPQPEARQEENAGPRYASSRRWPHVLWVDEHGEPVPTPQFGWEPPRLYTRGMEGLADGVPAWLASALNKRGVAATGNAQVPQVVEVIGRAMLAVESHHLR